MKKIYYLSSCDTCRRIIQELGGLDGFEFQDIKSDQMTADQLDQMKKLAGSYEALFSRRARKYRSMGLHETELSEKDYRKLILEEYTFLKRPVILWEDQIFIGNAKSVVQSAKKALGI